MSPSEDDYNSEDDVQDYLQRQEMQDAYCSSASSLKRKAAIEQSLPPEKRNQIRREAALHEAAVIQGVDKSKSAA